MIKKIAVKVFMAVLLTIIISLLSDSLMPVFGNEVAVGQLQNDDVYFIAMNAWHNLQNWLGAVTGLIWLAVSGLIGKDIYKEMKNKNKKENM